MTSSNNDTVLPLNDLHLPDVPSWFPLAWGWWATVAAVVLVLLLITVYLRWQKKRLAPKKTALLLIPKEKPAAAIELVRQVALCYYPREQIAQLTGRDWYVFLDSQIDSPLFESNFDQWQKVLYSRQTVENSNELVEHCSQWVNQALPPKKRRA
ncbi:DUF4381 domain-containing protein [Vibrio scophthalmi]|uniref:DUF4381 domain-containing protein n=1 Tax=Vibrio scophthalmi TaxID=45658 RepID=UPI003872A82A